MDTRARDIHMLGENVSQLLAAIDGCVQAHLVLPALMLVYGGIDVLGALERRPGEGRRGSFVRWTEKYLLPAKPLGCAPIDLYAARCGVLHTFSAESDLYRQGKARRLIYAWGTGSVAKLERAANLLGHADVTVHLSDLADAFRHGTLRYFDEVWSDPVRREAVLASAAGVWLGTMPATVVDEFLERARDYEALAIDELDQSNT